MRNVRWRLGGCFLLCNADGMTGKKGAFGETDN